MAVDSTKFYTLFSMMLMATHCHGNTDRRPVMAQTHAQDVLKAWIPSPRLSTEQPSLHNVSQKCLQDLQVLLTQGEVSMLALDAFGKPTPGMLVGNTAWLGHFDECMSITDFKHCLVDLDINVTLGSNSSMALTINWGVCVPVSCSESDVQNGLELLLGYLNVDWISFKNMYGSAAHCTNKPNTEFSGGFIGTCILIGMLLLLSIMGTIADKCMKYKESSKAHHSPSEFTSNGPTTIGKRSSQVVPNGIGSNGTSVTLSKEGQRSNIGSGNSEGGDGRHDRLLATVENGKATPEKDRRVQGLVHATPTETPPPQSTAETTPLLDVSSRNDQQKQKPGMLVRLLLCFAISCNLPKILSTRQGEGSISCLNGIRVISISWVILAHSVSMVLKSGLSENTYSAFFGFLHLFIYQPMVQGSISVDTFFVLSGCLVTYLTLKKMKAKNGKVGWGMFYLHRYLRLTPALAMLILVWMFIFPELNQGPVWYRTETKFDICRYYWWSDLLYINNFVPPALGDDCISWGWYLACDMQFYFISPLLLIPLYRFPKIGLSTIAALCVASFITTAVIVYQNNFGIGLVAGGDTDGAFQTLDVGAGYLPADDYSSMVYIKPYCRIPPYLVGMVVGYLLHHIGKKKSSLNPVAAAGGWAIALTLAMTVVFGIYDVNRGVTIPSVAANVMYNTFSRFAWALAVAWVIFACHYGYGGMVNDFLSWSFWVPLGRLTYSTYLLHPVIQNLYGFSQATPIHWSFVTISILYGGFLLLGHACGFIMCLLVEFPFVNLEKLLFTASHRPRRN
ncbi:O-acyltransferase like protein-like [Diadema antillarum]|uniref:O-acyltransferase like protein-like n=1 Tax=Diadema antillarum TaxID=105358 RepID=UPI003A8610BA